MSSIDFTGLAGSAEEYGPYLFAILFVLGLTVAAQRAYAGAKNDEQVKTLRFYFFTCFFFGLFLVVFCVGAWTYDKEMQHKYVYTVDIQNVPPTTGFWSTSSNVCILSNQIQGLPVAKVHAIFVENQRLAPGASLEITEAPVGGVGPAPSPSDVKSIPLPVSAEHSEFDFGALGPAKLVQAAER